LIRSFACQKPIPVDPRASFALTAAAVRGNAGDMASDPAAKTPPGVVKIFNRLAGKIAGSRWFPPWAQLHHRGRRSGTAYVTPVAVLVTPETVVIGLPWGPGTDWVRNVMAAGGCTIRWKGHDYAVTAPQLVDKSVALAAANRFQSTVIKRAKFPAYLQLRRPAP
jgi:deazaflavin-dependent oxidoreductase (nitroreductase family)